MSTGSDALRRPLRSTRCNVGGRVTRRRRLRIERSNIGGTTRRCHATRGDRCAGRNSDSHRTGRNDNPATGTRPRSDGASNPSPAPGTDHDSGGNCEPDPNLNPASADLEDSAELEQGLRRKYPYVITQHTLERAHL